MARRTRALLVGVLANVDESILQLGDLEGLDVVRVETTRLAEVILAVAGQGVVMAYRQILADVGLSPQSAHCFILGGAKEVSAKIDPRKPLAIGPRDAFDAELEKLWNDFGLLRLFSDGNVCMPFKMLYTSDGRENELLGWGWDLGTVVRVPYILPAESGPDVRRFPRTHRTCWRSNTLRVPTVKSRRATRYHFSKRRFSWFGPDWKSLRNLPGSGLRM